MGGARSAAALPRHSNKETTEKIHITRYPLGREIQPVGDETCHHDGPSGTIAPAFPVGVLHIWAPLH